MIQTVSTTSDTGEPDHFAEIAAELRQAADRIETLVGSGFRTPGYFSLNIQPGTRGDDASTAAHVDALGLALVGKAGQLHKMHDGTYHYDIGDTRCGPIKVSIYQSVSTEWALKREAAAQLAAKEAELAKLRAEVAALKTTAGTDAPAHEQVSGWGGIAGECGAACACGTTFDNFDTLGEAVALLSRHIADAAPDHDRIGLNYSREADDPVPGVVPNGVEGGPVGRAAVPDAGPYGVANWRAPLSDFERRAGVAEPAICAPADDVSEHREAKGWTGPDTFGSSGVECACGVTFDGFNTLAEAGEMLKGHIEAATSPTGLTRAADQARGPLAFTTPVVAYFSFGHGQADPDSGKNLLDHYVTVVAPTYEECREAMLASRFGRVWSADYLAGNAKSDMWIAGWTEHEVIVAPGTDGVRAAVALKAARDLLTPGGQ